MGNKRALLTEGDFLAMVEKTCSLQRRYRMLHEMNKPKIKQSRYEV